MAARASNSRTPGHVFAVAIGAAHAVVGPRDVEDSLRSHLSWTHEERSASHLDAIVYVEA